MQGERITDDSFYVIFNAHHEPLPFTLPDSSFAQDWLKVIDTNEKPPRGDRRRPQQELAAGAKLDVAGRSVVVLQKTEPE
jgi:glycogen operon protein